MEEKNIENIKMINKAYEILEKIPLTRKLSMFENAIMEYHKIRAEKENHVAAIKKEMSLRIADFKLYCGKCDTYITDSSNLRLYRSYYVPFDPELWKLVEFRPISVEKDNYHKKRSIGISGMIHCKYVDEDGTICNKKIGCATNFKGIMLPSLSCKNITFIEKGNNQVKTAKKWKKDVFKNLFYPNDISHKELLAMKTFEYQPNLDEVVEALGKESLAAYGILSVNDN